MNNKKRFLILSNNNIERLESRLTQSGLSYKKVLGSYKNVSETSFVVIASEDHALDFARFEAFHADTQESILIVDEDRKARLEFANGSTIPLGDFQAVSSIEATSLDGWTLDLETYQYYGVK